MLQTNRATDTDEGSHNVWAVRQRFMQLQATHTNEWCCSGQGAGRDRAAREAGRQRGFGDWTMSSGAGDRKEAAGLIWGRLVRHCHTSLSEKQTHTRAVEETERQHDRALAGKKEACDGLATSRCKCYSHTNDDTTQKTTEIRRWKKCGDDMNLLWRGKYSLIQQICRWIDEQFDVLHVKISKF